MTTPAHRTGRTADPKPMDVLPLNVGFAVEYLDGVMSCENREIQQQWATVRKHIISAGSPAAFYGAQCPSHPNCTGGCGLGCTHEIESARAALSASRSTGDQS